MTTLPQIADMPMALDAEAALPEPMVPADVDLSKLDGFMLDTVKLLGSELVALSTGDEFKAALLLWCRAWKQRPGGSLPNDDRILASFAGVPAAKWRKVKDMAMRGWILCSDGRWYHPVLAADAIRAHKAAEQRRAAIRKRYEREDEQDTKNDTPVPTAVASPVLPETGRDGTGRDSNIKNNNTDEPALPLGDTPEPRRPRKKPVTSWPDDFALDEDLAAYSRKHLPAESPKALFEQFRNYHQAKGSQFADWRAAFRTWVSNAVKFAGKSKS